MIRKGLKQRGFRDLAGLRVEAALPISREFLNQALTQARIPSVERVELTSLEAGVLTLGIHTRVPLYRNKVIQLKPRPSDSRSPLVMELEVLGGLNRMERWLLGKFSTSAIRTRGAVLVIDLFQLALQGTDFEPLATSVRGLELRARDNRLELVFSFLHPEKPAHPTSPS